MKKPNYLELIIDPFLDLNIQHLKLLTINNRVPIFIEFSSKKHQNKTPQNSFMGI